jgi:hypothetical protein
MVPCISDELCVTDLPFCAMWFNVVLGAVKATQEETSITDVSFVFVDV